MSDVPVGSLIEFFHFFGWRREMRFGIVLSVSADAHDVFWVLVDDCTLVMLPTELFRVVA